MASIVTNTKDDNEKKPTKKMVARGEIDDLMGPQCYFNSGSCE